MLPWLTGWTGLRFGSSRGFQFMIGQTFVQKNIDKSFVLPKTLSFGTTMDAAALERETNGVSPEEGNILQ
ncbi:MAG: hypothetical protein ACR2NX_05455 [Chthoniobacterales bacterium]